MGLVSSYLTAFVSGAKDPRQRNSVACHFWPTDVATVLGLKHGRWVGRWLHGIPTRAMVYKIFVLAAGVLIGFGYVCNDQYYRPISGILIGTVGLTMFAIWGISDDDVR